MIGAASPGPSFFVVARISIASGQANGLAAALGMGCGGAAFAALALFGLQVVIQQFHTLYLVFKVLGGLYLVWLALSIWRAANTPLPEANKSTDNHLIKGIAWRDFVRGFTTQMANPKTAIVYAGVFAALLPANAPVWTAAVLIPMLFCIEAGWYTIVATVFSLRRPRSAYLAFKPWVDRCAALVIGGLGASLAADALDLD
jgi:threonine/homoserine/homoserine lactone efflux protein